MKTAEEFLVRDELFKTPLTEEEKHYYIDRIITYDDYIKGMIEFAKYHVQKALKQASEKAFVEYIDLNTDEIFDYTDVITDDNVGANVNKESILNAYSLEKIK